MDYILELKKESDAHLVTMQEHLETLKRLGDLQKDHLKLQDELIALLKEKKQFIEQMRGLGI